MIGLDIDGVLADFVAPFFRFLEDQTGCGPIDPQTYVDPYLSGHAGLSKEMVTECVMRVSDDPRFWETLAPLPSAEQWLSLDQLSRRQKLVFVTHRYERDNYDIGQVTSDWLRKHGVADPVVYFTQSRKSELIGKLKIELFVDDRHENCRDVAENTDAVVLMPDRLYNQSFNHPRVQRIQDLDRLFDYIE